jgi:hypothetical protein
MACNPPDPRSLANLRQLRDEVHQRGDICLAMLLSGIELYTVSGQEWELLEIMRKFAHEADDMIRNTPTAAELRTLYERDESSPRSNDAQ